MNTSKTPDTVSVPSTELTITKTTALDLATLDAPEEIKARCLALAEQMAGNVEGFEGGPKNWMPAKLKIVQPVTQDPAKPEDAKNGDFFSKVGPVKRPLRGVLAYVWSSRSYFKEGEDSCWSQNVDTASRAIADDKSNSIYGDKCASCPKKAHPRTPQKKDANGKPVKQQLCQNITNVLFVAEDMAGVYHLEFKGASSAVGRQLVDMARAGGLPWATLFSLDTEQKKRDGGGLYYVFKYSRAGSPPGWLKQIAASVKEYFAAYREEAKTETRERAERAAETIDINSISDGEVEAAAKKKGVKDEF